MGQPPMRDVQRFAGMRLGALFAMTSGLRSMQQLPADSWDSQQLVSISKMTTCVLELQDLGKKRHKNSIGCSALWLPHSKCCAQFSALVNEGLSESGPVAVQSCRVTRAGDTCGVRGKANRWRKIQSLPLTVELQNGLLSSLLDSSAPSSCKTIQW